MDDHDERAVDDLDDARLGALLRQHADDLVGAVDVDAALIVTQQRVRSRRRWRVATSAVVAAAAAAVLVVAATALVSDGKTTVRIPAATSDVPRPTVTPIVLPSSTSVVATPTTSLPAVPDGPSTTPVGTPGPGAIASTTQGATGDPAPTGPAPTTTTYSSAGGSIVIRAEGGAVALDRDPSPADGWTFRIDDDGPSRVRVRFELDGRRSEIRVELVDGQPVPEIIEQ